MSSRSVDLNKGGGNGHGKGRGKRERQGGGKSGSKGPQVYPWPQAEHGYGHWHGHGYGYWYGHMEGPVIHGYGAQVAGGGYAGPVAYEYGAVAHSRSYGYADTQRKDVTTLLDLPPALTSGTRSSAAIHAGEALFAAVRARMATITVSVVRLSGDAILESMEIQTKDTVSVIKSKVKEALGTCLAQVDLVVKGRKLSKDQLIEDSGLVDGDTVTALLKMPTRVWRHSFLHGMEGGPYEGDRDFENQVLLECNGSCASIYSSSPTGYGGGETREEQCEYCVKLGTYIEEGSTAKITWACQVHRRGRSAWCLDVEGGQESPFFLGQSLEEDFEDVIVANRTGMSIKLDRRLDVYLDELGDSRDREWCSLSDDEVGSLHSCLTSFPELDQLLLLLEGEGFPNVVPEKTKREEEGSAGP